MKFTPFKMPTFSIQPDLVQVSIGICAVSLAISWLWGA